MKPPPRDRDQIIGALDELALRLSRNNIRAGIRVVGGAALAIAHERRATWDIDVTIGPDEDVVVSASRSRRRTCCSR